MDVGPSLLPDAPTWFRRALAVPRSDVVVDVGGAPIHALLRSEHGLVTDDIGASMYEAMGRVTPVIELPEAGHHAMLDQPLVLLTALRTLLADWDHSRPLRP